MPVQKDKALAAFYGLALGDALGMPSQSMSRARIRQKFGFITTLLAGPADQPIAPGMPPGRITDDTEQAELLARLLIEWQGQIPPRVFANALLSWEDAVRSRQSLDLLGPSTQKALARIAEGEDPDDAGRSGATNGAAMRITPVAIAYSAKSRPAFLDAVVRACRVTHNTSLGIASAAAVAGVVSAGIEGATLGQALDVGYGYGIEYFPIQR